jgi:hypothetical protein
MEKFFDARFPHLKHPFLEMYAIYKRKYRKRNYIQLFPFFFLLRLRRLVVVYPFEIISNHEKGGMMQ